MTTSSLSPDSPDTTFLRFLRNVFGGVSRPGSPNVEVLCPWCVAAKRPTYNNRKLSVKVENHLVNCWVCGYRSRNLYHVIRTWYPEHLGEYLDLVPVTASSGSRRGWVPTEDECSEESEESVTLPRSWTLLAENTSSGDSQVKSALAYLRSRKVWSKDLLWFWKFGVAPDDLPWRVVLPSFDAMGNLNFWTARSVLPNPRVSYWNAQGSRTGLVWNEVHIDWGKPLVIAEGPFDLVACGPRLNATILLGARLGDRHLLFQRVLEHRTPVVLALDPDQTRETLATASRLFRLGTKVDLLRLPPGVKDLGSLSTHEIGALLRTSAVEPFSPFLSRVRLTLDTAARRQG